MRLNTYAAIKLLHGYLAENEADSFLREARTIAALRHPNIVRVFDFDVKQGQPFIVMDYYKDGTLRKLHGKKARLPLPLVITYVQQIAQALQYAHDRKIIHRDVKPENMLVGEDTKILLGDFGIAAIAHSTSSRSTQVPLGTTFYMAPEQIQAQACLASDQYALAVVVYEWLCGTPPFVGSPTEVLSKHLIISPPSLCAQLPNLVPEVEQVIMKALAKDPRQRFASVRDFAEALQSEGQKQTAGLSRFSTFKSEATSYPSVEPLPPTVQAPPREHAKTAKAPETTSAAQKDSAAPRFRSSHFRKDKGRRGRSIDVLGHRPRFSLPRRKLITGLAVAGVVAAGGFVGWHTLFPYYFVPGLISVYHGHSGSISALAWSPDDRRIASGGGNGDSTVQVWDATTGNHAYTFNGHVVTGPFGPLYTVFSVSWSPDGKHIVSTSQDAGTLVWEVGSKKDPLALNTLGLSTTAAAWSPNGKFITWAWDYDQVRVGDVNDPNSHNYVLGNSDDVGDEVQALAWSPDGTHIAFACYKNIVQSWDLASRQSSTYRGHTDVVHTVAWSTNGRYIASGSKDKTVRVWDTVSGKAVFVYKGHSDEVQSVSWSPDSKRVASASNDGTVQVWDALSGEHVFVYQGHNNPLQKRVMAVAWSHNGNYIASGGDDHTVQVWQAQ